MLPCLFCFDDIEPAATEPAATESAATGPAATKPAATKPAATSRTATERAATGPTATGPAATEPAATSSVGRFVHFGFHGSHQHNQELLTSRVRVRSACRASGHKSCVFFQVQQTGFEITLRLFSPAKIWQRWQHTNMIFILMYKIKIN